MVEKPKQLTVLIELTKHNADPTHSQQHTTAGIAGDLEPETSLVSRGQARSVGAVNLLQKREQAGRFFQ